MDNITADVEPGLRDIPVFIPQLSIEIPDDDGSLLGFLAIDSVFAGRCCGGIRMGPDVTHEEVCALASAMTRKFAFMNVPLGGAKSGLLCPADADAAERERRLRVFGRRLSPILRSVYTTGGDIGTGPADTAVIKEAAGLPARVHAGTFRGGFYTAFGVFTNIMTWLEHAGITAREATVTLEGYGSVGMPLARLLYEAGVRIVAISTVQGVLLNADGLDIPALELARSEHGDACVRHFDRAERAPTERLFQQPATVIVPGARAWSINRANVETVSAQAVISSANVPVTPAAIAILERAGTIVVPDFVSNSAGIFGSGLLGQGFSEDRVRELVTRIYRARLIELLRINQQTGESLHDIAERSCRQNLERLRTTTRSTAAWLGATLREEHGWARVAERAALALFSRSRSVFGSDSRVPGALTAAATEAIYHRAVRPIGA